MTEQEAIKKMLVLVGEDPELPSSATPYTLAKTILEAVTQEVTSSAWKDVTQPTTDISSVPDYLVEYIITKAAYYYAMGYTGENVFTQELLAQLQKLEQDARMESLRQSVDSSSYEDILERIRIQLKNEQGWWYNTVIDEHGNQTLNAPLTLPALVDEYAKAKAKRLFTAYQTGNLDLLVNPSTEEQELYQKMVDTNKAYWLKAASFEEVLNNVRVQLMNEVGWWYNTTEDANGNLIVNVPTTLPQIVEQYAEAKARRIFTAYQTGNLELLVKVTPEEQELYQKMLQEHNRQLLKSKSLTTLKTEVTRELLMMGWDFNTVEDTYGNIKAAGYQLLSVRALDPSVFVFLDSDGLVKDNRTRQEVSEDVKLKVLIDVSYNNLPPLFKSYVDLKARRLFKHYEDPSGRFNKPSVDEQTLFMRLKTLHRRDIDTPNMLYNDSQQYNFRGW